MNQPALHLIRQGNGSPQKQKAEIPVAKTVDVFVAPIKEDTRLKAFEIAQKLRKVGVSTDVDLTGRKLKKVLSHADSLGTSYVVLVGARDLEEGKVTVKNMKTGTQEMFDVADVAVELKNRLLQD